MTQSRERKDTPLEQLLKILDQKAPADKKADVKIPEEQIKQIQSWLEKHAEPDQLRAGENAFKAAAAGFFARLFSKNKDDMKNRITAYQWQDILMEIAKAKLQYEDSFKKVTAEYVDFYMQDLEKEHQLNYMKLERLLIEKNIIQAQFKSRAEKINKESQLKDSELLFYMNQKKLVDAQLISHLNLLGSNLPEKAQGLLSQLLKSNNVPLQSQAREGHIPSLVLLREKLLASPQTIINDSRVFLIESIAFMLLQNANDINEAMKFNILTFDEVDKLANKPKIRTNEYAEGNEANELQKFMDLFLENKNAIRCFRKSIKDKELSGIRVIYIFEAISKKIKQPINKIVLEKMREGESILYSPNFSEDKKSAQLAEAFVEKFFNAQETKKDAEIDAQANPQSSPSRRP